MPEINIPIVLTGEFKLVHEDARRRIEEVNGDCFCFQRFTVKSRDGMGNHYHAVQEMFIFVAGDGGTIYLVQSSDPDKREKVTVRAGSVVIIPHSVAHLFVMEPGTVFTCYSPIRFEEKHRRTTGFKIEPWE